MLTVKTFSRQYLNKTAGYDRHILRFPNLVNSILKGENVYLQRSIFFDFYCQKNLMMWVEKILKKYYDEIRILLQIYYLKRFYKKSRLFEKPIYFFRKTPNFERIENSYYSSRILRKFATF